MLETRNHLAWLGACAFSLAVSTLGVGLSVGAFAYTVLVPILGRDMVWGKKSSYLPYYVLLIAFGILTGFLTRLRWNSLCKSWIWILPVAYLAFAIVFSLASGNTLAEALLHCLGKSGRERFEDTWPLYSSSAYSVGSILFNRLSPLQKKCLEGTLLHGRN